MWARKILSSPSGLRLIVHMRHKEGLPEGYCDDRKSIYREVCKRVARHLSMSSERPAEGYRRRFPRYWIARTKLRPLART
jgi:hypothetical protein